MKKEFYKSMDVKDAFLNSLGEQMMVIVYDVETTGLSPELNHIIQLSARKCFTSENGLEEAESRNWFINPGYALPEKIVKLTGITDDQLSDKPREEEVIEEIVDFFGSEPVVGYNNIKFDDKFFCALFNRYGYVFEPDDSIDLYKVVKELIGPGETVNRKLPTVTDYFELREAVVLYCEGERAEEGDSVEETSDPFHDARGDTMATLLCFNKCVERARIIREEMYIHKIHCVVKSVEYWMNPRKQTDKRIYVETDNGSFWFSIMDLTWHTKSNAMHISQYDMNDIIKQTLELTSTENEAALTRYRGHLKVPRNSKS